MLEIVRIIRCDGEDCKKKFRSTGTAVEARKAAFAKGWSRDKNKVKDWCPEHSYGSPGRPKNGPPVGSKHYGTHLKEQDIRDIREMWASPTPVGVNTLAAWYKITPGAIKKIVRRESWRHVQ